MPITYTFVTSLIIPTTADFDCMDVGEGSMPNILLFPEVTASRGAPWFTIDGSNDLVITSDDGVLSRFVMDLPISQKFTVETTFKPSVLPNDLTQLNNYRFFIGGYDKQDNAGGVLVSQLGIALVASFGLSAFVIPGSQNLFTEGEEYHTLRIVVDGVTNTMNVYVTKTDQLGITGHVLRYTSAAPLTPGGVLDSVQIEVVGQATKPITGKFSTLRVSCTQALIPNQRPIADPGADQTANIGSAVTHDGRESFDPEGEPLTYDWRLKDAPDSSRFKSAGTGGVSIDDGDADGFTPIFDGGTDAFSITNMPLLQPGDHLIIDAVLYEVAATRWSFNSTTGKFDRDSPGTWNDDEVVVVPDTIPDSLTGQAYKVLHSATYFSDRDVAQPSAIADIVGVYIVELVVNDGVLDSLPAEALLNVNQTSTALGCIPDVGFIWDHLADFWNLLEDREKVETAWSGFAQAAAAQLLTAWQVDYNKSLLDTQRVFQRRWLSYSTLLEETAPDDATIRIIRGPIFTLDLTAGANVNGKTLQILLDGGGVETVTFVGGGSLTATTIAAQINAALGFTGAQTLLATVVVKGAATYVKLEHSMLLRIRPQGTANADLGFSATEYTQNDLAGFEGGTQVAGKFLTFLGKNVTATIADDPDLDFTALGINSSDLLVRGTTGYKILKVALDSTSGESRALTLTDPLSDDTLDDWLIPSVVVSDVDDYSLALVQAGDLAWFEIKDTVNRTPPQFVYCEIVGLSGRRIGFNPQPLLEAYAGVPSNFTTKFKGVKYTQAIPVNALVLEIPRLQEIIKDPPGFLSENIDYTIDDTLGSNAIQFTAGTFSLTDPPPDTFWAEVTYLDNRTAIEDNFGRLVNFKVDDLDTRTDDLDYLSAVRGLWWAYFGGPALERVQTGVQILLGLPFAEAEGVVESLEANFSATEGRLSIRDTADKNILRTYFYPLLAGLAINELTGELIAEGDTVSQFAPLSGGVEVKDYVSSPLWMQKYVAQGKFFEIDKFFRFLVRADIDTFNLTNLIFAIDFVKKIKPHYTFPLFVVLKNVDPVEVDVGDLLTANVVASFFDTFCPDEEGSYRWDDTDESGNWNHIYDAVPPPPRFLYDTHRLCPTENLWVHISYTHPGGAGWFYDTIWAYDDGDTTGDTFSNDLLPLSGPDSSPPAPYGPLVGTIFYDAGAAGDPPPGPPIPAGVYHRERTL